MRPSPGLYGPIWSDLVRSGPCQLQCVCVWKLQVCWGSFLSLSFLSPTLARSGVWCLFPPAGFLLTLLWSSDSVATFIKVSCSQTNVHRFVLLARLKGTTHFIWDLLVLTLTWLGTRLGTYLSLPVISWLGDLIYDLTWDYSDLELVSLASTWDSPVLYCDLLVLTGDLTWDLPVGTWDLLVLGLGSGLYSQDLRLMSLLPLCVTVTGFRFPIIIKIHFELWPSERSCSRFMCSSIVR